MASFFVLGPPPTEPAGDPDRAGDCETSIRFFSGRFGTPVNSLPSTLQLSRSFHSSPISPPYLSSSTSCVGGTFHSPPSPCSLLFSVQNVFQASLPPSSMRFISGPLKASMLMLRTKEMWTPRERWRPAQERQMKMPNLGEAHCGEGAEQSAQRVLGGSFWRVRS